MNPSGDSVLDKAKLGLLPEAPLITTVTGSRLKSVLALPMLAPAFTPTYQPVQFQTGAGGGAAGTPISAANADVPTKPVMATTQVANLFMAVPPKDMCLITWIVRGRCCAFNTVKGKARHGHTANCSRQ